MLSGLRDLVVLKTSGSEFSGFIKDRYTTLQETRDRILCTAVNARWRHRTLDSADFGASFAHARRRCCSGSPRPTACRFSRRCTRWRRG